MWNVNETEFAVKLEAHEHEIGSLKHRMREQEEQSKSISELVLSVQKLAINMEQMIKEQKNQSERLQELEQKPAKQWGGMKQTILNAIVGAGAGAFATGFFISIAQYIK